MRRSAVIGLTGSRSGREAPPFGTAVLVIILLAAATLAGCGGGKGSSTDNTPASIQVSPSVLSLNLGDVASVGGTVVNKSGTAVTNAPTLSFSSSNTSVATVSKTGSVCAGKWDANFIVCDTTGFAPGTANITVTAGSVSGTIPVFTHLRVDRVTVSPALVNCVSSGQTQQMSATAFNNGVDITSTVGPITWTTASVDVATIDANGLVTGKTPGQTGVVASVSLVRSVPATWVTCPVQSINIHVTSGTDTTFTLGAAGNTVNLAADVVDRNGVSVSAPLTWSSSQSSVASVNSTALVTAVGAGTVGITASCAGNCNVGLGSVYSNVVKGTVSGTSATTVYATGTNTTSLIPIDSGTNAAGTAITLPAMPNSFVFDHTGSTAYLGSSGALMILNAAANTVTQNTAASGRVLAVSPDNTRVIVAGSNTVFVFAGAGGLNTESSSIAGATAADFTTDSRGAYIVAGNTVYFWSPGLFRPIGLAGLANDVKFLANGAFAYFAGASAGPAATALATCNNSVADTVTTQGTPRFVASLVDASKVLAVDSPGIDVIAPSTSRVGCPPPLSDAVSFVNFGMGAFTARQFIVLPDGSKAFVTSDLGQLLGLDVAAATPFLVPLNGAATAFTGGSTQDGKMVYVGGSDNKVHRIDVAASTDAQQIGVSFTPDLVAVRPK